MALAHVTALRNTLADAAVDSLDTGTTDPNGDLVYATAGAVEVAILAFAASAFGVAAAGIATAAAIASDTNATGGLVAICILQNRDNAEQFRGSVTATSGGGDIELTNLTIGAGDTVSTSSLTYEAPV